MAEWRCWGPPGTGKTHYLKEAVEKYAREYGADHVRLASFTKAAASELAARVDGVPKENIATLHAHAYRALGHPEMIEKHIPDWNEGYPTLALSGAGGSLDEPDTDMPITAPGDQLYNQYNICRAKMLPKEEWPENVLDFAEKWVSFKDDIDAIDFTDMIEHAYHDTSAPEGTEVLIGDESQDLSRLEMALMRKWGEHIDVLLLAADDDQAIFSFKGADPNALLDHPVPPERTVLLSQSYRVPASIVDFSTQWVSQLQRREDKPYLPRRLPDGSFAQGEVRRSTSTWRVPEDTVVDIKRDLASGLSCMVLTACSYMLEPIKAILRQEGMTYHNPYRQARGDWNPITAAKGVTTAARLAAFLAPLNRKDGNWSYWSGAELNAWAAQLAADGNLIKGAKTELKGLASHYNELDPDTLRRFLTDPALWEAMQGNVDWLIDNVIESKRRNWNYPLAVYKNSGYKALTDTPRLTIGTIHSVKGGESQSVYVFPDVSAAGADEWERGGEGHESIIRQFYVGFTRASENLTICSPASRGYVNV